MTSVHRLCLVVAALLSGCTAIVDPIREIPTNPEGCIQRPTLRGTTRSLTAGLTDMSPHADQRTVVTIVPRGYDSSLPDGSPRPVTARALLLPTAAASLGPRRLVRRPDTSRDDGLQCIASGAGPVHALFRIDSALPPDATNGGPYRIDFWSDLSRSGGMRDPAPVDHAWSAAVCDDGTFRFQHNTGFEDFPNAEGSGLFRLRLGRPAINALSGELGGDLETTPLVVEIRRGGTSVGLIKTELECVVPEADGTIVLDLPGVIDGGAAHTITMYFDRQRNGQLDTACDPTCTVSRTAGSGAILELTGRELVEMEMCTRPTAPPSDCLPIEPVDPVDFFAPTNLTDAGTADGGS